MASWTESLHKTRYVMDIFLLVLFVLANVPQISLPFHEWISFVFIIPFIVHLLLHYDWAVETPKRFFKKLGGENRFNLIFDAMLYLMMIFVIVSGVLASEVVLPLFGEFAAQPFWTDVHHQYSNLLIPMVGIHLGMHWRWIVNITRSMFSADKGSRADVAEETPVEAGR